MSNLREIFRLPKWAKISLVALSVVAIALLVAVFALQSWADSQIESANLSFSKVGKAKSVDLEGGYVYEAKVHFTRLEFLLRSKSISKINIDKIAWSGIDLSMIQSVESISNRYLSFITTQQLNLDSGANLGIMSYKIDFAPFGKAIIKYYITLMALFALTIFCHNILNHKINNSSYRFIEILKTESLPSVLWQSYKSINPLYRHTFWIVFIACNIVFGFDTAQFVWGRESWGMTFGNIGGNWAVAQGRWTQNVIAPYLTQDLMLPILNNVLAFVALSVASILLCVYLNVARKLWIWAIVGFVLTLSPFTLARMYFTYQVVGLFIAVAIGILGFVLARKAGEYSLATNGGGRFSHALS